MGWLERTLVVGVLVLNAVSCGGEAGEEGEGPLIMASVEVDACEQESAHCWQNDGPHPVLSYDTANMDPSTMRVRLMLDGAPLLTSSEPANDLTVIMRSPHESLKPIDGHHSLGAQVLNPEGAILAEASADFTFDLRDRDRSPPEPQRAPCPVMHGSEATFDYRGGDGHGTHQPVLHAAVLGTSGPVVEFGMGFFSTPMLHDLCKAAGRKLISMDTEDSWVDKFRHLGSDLHEVRVVKGWDEGVEPSLSHIFNSHWGVAFIDQHPEHTRIEVARRVKGQTEVVVMHDAYRQLGQPGFAKYSAEFGHFREYFPPRPFPVLAGPPTLAASADPALLPHVDFYHYDQWCYDVCEASSTSDAVLQQCRRTNQPRAGVPWQREREGAQKGEGGKGGRLQVVDEDEAGEGEGEGEGQRERGVEATLKPVVKAAVKASQHKVLVIGTGDAGAAAVREVCAEEGRELVWVSVGGGVRGDEHVRSWDQGRGELERILRREKWGVVVVDFMGFQELWDWLVVHDCERLLKGDLLRLPADMEGRCFHEHFPPRPWPVLSGPSSLVVAGRTHVTCTLHVP